MGSLKDEGGVNKSYFLGRDEIRRLMTMRSVVVIINLYEHPLNLAFGPLPYLQK